MSRHAGDIQLVIAGTGPLKQYLKFRAGRLLARKADIGFHKHADMPDLLRSGDLFVHCSIADIESVSVIEAMACGLVPVRADRRVVVPRARRGPAGPTHRLVDRTSGRARRMGRKIRRIHQGALFRGSLGPQVRGYGTQGDRGIGAFSFAERSFPQSACGGQLPHQRDLRKNLPLMREVASRSDDGGRDLLDQSPLTYGR